MFYHVNFDDYINIYLYILCIYCILFIFFFCICFFFLFCIFFFFFIRICFLLFMGAQVAQWVKRWPTDLADRVRSSLEVKSSQP